ncbi:MAG TPA: hypothetical protein VE713_05305 [Pyrinomonadaceae bacterium]|jgi:hypothetical protein|nr:hypothetical protein [Pyrinomonadaceae bacterium]
MILEVLYSVSGVPIRLTEERWEHLVDRHPHMSSYYEGVLEAVQEPEYILHGRGRTFFAVETLGKRKYLYVLYKEVSRTDGFIITAYTGTRLDKSKIVWRREDHE